MRMIRFLLIGCAALTVGVSLPSVVSAQNNFDKLYEEMMKEFFPQELRKEIESLDRNDKSGSFFKNDPRFLEIKRKEIVSRPVDRVEKQHPQNLAPFRQLTSQSAKSIVAIFKDDEATSAKDRLCFGTAITSSLMVTKADELDGLDEVVCRNNNGNQFKATVVRIVKKHDLAILKSARPLKPIMVNKNVPELGSFLVSAGNSDQPIAVGAMAVKPRSIVGKNRGFLGVEPQPGENGVFIKSVTPRSAAFRAGMEEGDIVVSINGVKTREVAELVREIGSKKKGDSIKLDIRRRGKAMQITATLDGRTIRGERAARFEMMRRLGALVSKRSDEFPVVFEHDTPILPNHCGGPLLDLDGKAVGINIARAGRTSSYALPIELVKELVSSEVN